MKLSLSQISFYFDGEDAEYIVKYAPMEVAGTYDVGVFRNGNYLVSWNVYGSANKTHAKEICNRAIKWLTTQHIEQQTEADSIMEFELNNL